MKAEKDRSRRCQEHARVCPFSLIRVFEENTRQGIASVFPYRAPNRTYHRTDEDEYDRHGIPRCKHCGGQSRYVRFAAKPSPRLWFRCMEGATADCAKDQTIACSKNWRQLLPLWRLEPAYIALRQSHQHYERVHHLWRSRYRVGGASHDMRPKRRGVGCQQLRASAALLIEWIRVLHRNGWLGSARRNANQARKDPDYPDIIQRLINIRITSGVQLPYGPKAVQLGIGPQRPDEPPPG